MTREFYHMMVTSYFEGIFEVVRHNVGREEAKRYITMMGNIIMEASWRSSRIAPLRRRAGGQSSN